MRSRVSCQVIWASIFLPAERFGPLWVLHSSTVSKWKWTLINHEWIWIFQRTIKTWPDRHTTMENVTKKTVASELACGQRSGVSGEATSVSQLSWRSLTNWLGFHDKKVSTFPILSRFGERHSRKICKISIYKILSHFSWMAAEAAAWRGYESWVGIFIFIPYPIMFHENGNNLLLNPISRRRRAERKIEVENFLQFRIFQSSKSDENLRQKKNLHKIYKEEFKVLGN